MATIGEASRRSGLGIETIRFYEREGVVSAPARTSGGRRDYSPSDIAAPTFVSRCRKLGFPLGDVRTLLALREATDDQCKEVRAIAAEHIEDVRARIIELRDLEAALDELMAECHAGRAHCPALTRLFSATDD